MKKNIVLIIPPADIYLTPLLGIGILSAMAKSGGHNVNVIDLNILLYNDIEIDKLLWCRDLNHYWDSEDICDFIWDSKLREMLTGSHDFNDVDIVGIRISVNSKVISNKIAEWFNSNYPGIKLIGGGPQTWCVYNNHRYFDKMICGYAEKEFASIIGLTDYNKVIPDFSWASDYKYIKSDMLPIETGRGCVYRCSFCQERKFGKFEMHPIDFIETNLRLIKKSNFDEVYFVDSLINPTPNRLNRILNLTKDVGLKCHCNIVPFNLTKENIEGLKEVSKDCFVGIETFSDEFAGKLKKPGERSKILKVLDMMREVGLKIRTGIIVGGLPFQTEEELLLDIELIVSYGDVINKVIVSPLRIFNNSELFNCGMDYSEIGWEFNKGDFDSRLYSLKFMTKELEQAGIKTEVSTVGMEDWVNGLKREDKRFRRQQSHL